MSSEKNYIFELVLCILLIVSAYLFSFTLMPAIECLYYSQNNHHMVYICISSMCGFCLFAFTLFIRIIRIIILSVKEIFKKG